MWITKNFIKSVKNTHENLWRDIILTLGIFLAYRQAGVHFSHLKLDCGFAALNIRSQLIKKSKLILFDNMKINDNSIVRKER